MPLENAGGRAVCGPIVEWCSDKLYFKVENINKDPPPIHEEEAGR